MGEQRRGEVAERRKRQALTHRLALRAPFRALGVRGPPVAARFRHAGSLGASGYCSLPISVRRMAINPTHALRLTYCVP